MDVYASEQEQIESIKKWWKENWRSLAGGVALGLGGLYAFNAWRDHAKGQQEYASVNFQNMLTLMEQQKGDEAERLAKELRARAPNSIYSVFATLSLAKLAVDSDDLTRAAEYLLWAKEHTALAEVKHLTQTRLARVYLADNKADAAWREIEKLDTKAVLPSVQELKADVQLALGHPDEARRYYRKALDILGAGSGEAAALQSKADDLGTASTAAGLAK